MITILKYTQLILSVLLIIGILMQSKTEGFSATMSGQSSSFLPSRRGPEKVLFMATIVLAVLFVLSAIAFVIVA